VRPPSFDELVGHDLEPEEYERLRRAHDALVAAGPPPELPLALAAPSFAARRTRRRLVPLAAAAAVLAVALFGGGYALGDRSGDFEVRRTVALRAAPATPDASGEIKIGPRDENGNWEMLVNVRGLEPLPPNGYYTVYLTRDGEPIAECGSFRIERDDATVRFTVSYTLRRFDGWVVTLQPPGEHEPGEVVLET
jgi:hypothetical protein